MQTVLRLYICVDQAQRFCYTGRGIRFKLVFVHALGTMIFARRHWRTCCNPAHKKNYTKALGLKLFKLSRKSVHVVCLLDFYKLASTQLLICNSLLNPSPVWLLHIFMYISDEILVFDQENNFYLKSLIILITCLEDNLWIS